MDGYVCKLDKDVAVGLNDSLLMSTTGFDEATYLQKTCLVREAPFLLPAFSGKVPVYSVGEDPVISLVQRLATSPVAADSLEIAIALGTRKIFLLGCCGAVASDLEIGDIIVPLEIKRLEGRFESLRPC